MQFKETICLFWESNEIHEYTLWTEFEELLYVKAVLWRDNLYGSVIVIIHLKAVGRYHIVSERECIMLSRRLQRSI
jgi:hypothetical protein